MDARPPIYYLYNGRRQVQRGLFERQGLAMHDFPTYMGQRRAFFGSWRSDQRTLTQRLTAIQWPQFVLLALAESAAFDSLVDVLQMLHDAAEDRRMAQSGRAECRRFLNHWAAWITPSACSVTSCGLLQLAAYHGYLPVLEYLHLIQYRVSGANTFDRNDRQYADLDVAVERGHVMCLEYLHRTYTKNSKNWTFTNSKQARGVARDGRVTALDVACANGDVEMVIFLDTCGVPSTSFGLPQATARGHVAVVDLLRDRAADRAAKAAVTHQVKSCVAMVEFQSSTTKITGPANRLGSNSR
ncbi:Aste57867_14895 [Aphanomyces stellatus]|uniref:Aste57867_14895 protein n=1 Tax=Aphanomyces stellatus TaxID=120398 RepID=A0A485L4H9_9STRA|nr:hypothetical protein As57867_014839 [Aphanomyces stellatus]VFT91711.1 Aste57867_14895 [Aphanomyces stellatus]